MLRRFLKTIKGNIISELDNISQVRYEIGFPSMSIEQILSQKTLGEVHFLRHHYRDRWFADPFILDVDDNVLYLLVEEYFYDSGKGRIARLEVDRRSFRLISNEPVLELNTHLSFPFIRRSPGNTYIYPESCNSGQWKEYGYDPATNCITTEKLVLEEPLTDAVIDHKERVLTTAIPDPNSDTLKVYKEKDGAYLQTEVVRFDERIARNAGSVFNYGGRSFRPAQECNDSYGHSIVIQEISEDSRGVSFSEYCRFSSPHPVLKDGCHTFNVYKDVVVIDVNGPRKPRLKSFFSFVYRLVRGGNR